MNDESISIPANPTTPQSSQASEANSNPRPQHHDSDRQQSERSTNSDISDKIVDPLDLVYRGGYDRDPQEILGNPAVAPPMLSEGRDLRVDIFTESEEAAPDSDKDESL